MGDQTGKQADKIGSYCGWIFTAVVVVLAIVVCIGIVVFAVWLNT